MTATGRADLDAILDTLREVEVTLQARAARAEGANLMVWGVVASSIFGFYQLVLWNHDAYHALFGPLLPWVWVAPMMAGYATSAAIGARLGRVTRDPETLRAYRRGLIPGVLVGLLALVLMLTEQYEYTFGGITLLCGASMLAFHADGARTAFRSARLAVGSAMSLAGLALLAWPVPWAGVAAATVFAAGLLGLGTVRYRQGA